MFISFEGGECSGKTTQAQILRKRLTSEGYRSILVHEPGGTPLGEKLREIIKGDLEITCEAELLLFSAARAELVTKVIEPSLRSGIVVLTDRFSDSTVAYQGFARGLDLKHIYYMTDVATKGLKPDLTLLLDMDPEDALKRLGSLQMELSTECDPKWPKGRLDNQDQRKFEEQGLDFHRRVRKGYLDLSKEETMRWCVIEAEKEPDVIAKDIWNSVNPLLKESAAQTSNS